MVHASGLWNVNHVDETYNPEFLDVMTTLVERTTKDGNHVP
jgi:hypothetical protein